MDSTATLAEVDEDIQLDFDVLDALDAAEAQLRREVISGLPARPGTIRR